MARIHDARIVPSKIELLTAWVATQPWLDGADASTLTSVGTYRFDDPDGEVGIETHLVETADGRTLHIPLTFRPAPVDGPVLIGTMEHSVLGTRWVYDGCTDPVCAMAFATTILRGGEQAELVCDDGTVREPDTIVSGSGAPETLTEGEVELFIRRVLDGPFEALDEALMGTWAGQDDPTVLATAQVR